MFRTTQNSLKDSYSRIRTVLTILVIAVVFVSLKQNAIAQFDDSLTTRKISSFEGYHFLVGWMENETYIQSSGIRLRLNIATAYNANVTIKIPGNSPIPYYIAANSAQTVVIPSNMEVRTSEKVSNNVVEVTSDVPISVYAMNSQYTTSDSYAVVPTANWGNDYTIMSMPNDAYAPLVVDSLPPEEIRQSEFLIIAQLDGTVIKFTPTAKTELGKAKGVQQSVTLNKGQCYLVKASPLLQRGDGDLSGTSVSANQPIAVIGGHVRSAIPVPLDATVDSKDHLAEWLIPNNVLSTEYVSVPFKTDAIKPIGDYFKVIALFDSTHLFLRTERSDLNYIIKKAGDVLVLDGINSVAWWTSDKPISIGQFMYTGALGLSTQYDPAMVVMPPTNKFVMRSVLQTPQNLADPAFAQQYQYHFVNIVCDSNARHSIRLDGVNISKSIAPEILKNKHRSSPFFWAQIKITPGKHEIECDSGEFSGTLYGMGYTDSYAHTLGFAVVPATRDSISPYFTLQEQCGEVRGTVKEVENTTSSGLSIVVPDNDSTINYNITITPQLNNSNIMNIVAKPIDMFKDATLFIIARDKAGNGRRYRLYYKAPKFGNTNNVQFVAKTEKDSLCDRVFISCMGARDSMTIYSVRLAKNSPSLRLTSPVKLPALCGPKFGYNFEICFIPNGVGGLQVYDTLLADIGCGRIIRVPISGTTPTSSIAVTNIDFGDVLVGDTVCKQIKIKNEGTREATVTSATLNLPEQTFIETIQTQLPILLKSGDSVEFQICYSPTDSGNTQRKIIFGNTLNLDATGNIKGRGIKPIISFNGIDFGSRRIITDTDLSFVIKNSGNAKIDFTYNGQQSNSSIFLHSVRVNRTYTINPKDSMKVVVRFHPQDTITYNSALEFQSSWKLNKKISIPLSGLGTVPVLRTIPVRFDTIFVGTTKSLSFTTVRSKGNEPVTIDTMIHSGKDKSSFQISPSQLQSRKVSSGDSVITTVAFNPKSKGVFTSYILVTNDARKAYERTIDTVWITGFAKDSVKNDTVKKDTTIKEVFSAGATAILQVSPGTNVYACEPITILTQISDTSDVDLNVQEANIQVNISERDTIIQLQIPNSKLNKRTQTQRFVFEIPPLLKNGTIILNFRANDSIVIKKVLNLTVYQKTSELAVSDIVVKPDSVFDIHCSGSIHGTSPINQKLHFVTELNSQLVEIQSSLINLHVIDSKGDTQLACSVVQNADAIEVSTISAVPFLDTLTRWYVDVPVRSLFKSSLVQQEQFVQTRYISPNICQIIDTIKTLVSIQEVCANDLRNIALSGITIQVVAPQPVGEYVQLKLIVQGNQEVNIYTTDVFGRKILISENLLLQSGNHSLILATQQIPSGFHQLVIQSQDVNKQIPIVIIR